MRHEAGRRETCWPNCRCSWSYGSTADAVPPHWAVGLHNLALDPASDEVNGIFDYDSAAWADRHHDFRYLLFDVGRKDMLDEALEIYEHEVGRIIDRHRIRLYNAACAVSYLAFRAGTTPDQKSCGRTLAEDLRWVRTALTTSHDKSVAPLAASHTSRSSRRSSAELV
jgi:hypothetical protein